ncbi:transcriptional regulator VisN [Ensifer soli]|uniref:transcriptional regulator VisN n=1 Tax=Ciceribacter sp. sgz301302 TaxID=3342379 RepID=UPI0035B80FD0
MNMMHADVSVWHEPVPVARGFGRSGSRDSLIRKLSGLSVRSHLDAGLAALTDYVGARHYLLARCDAAGENGLDLVVCSDWPFDIVRRQSQAMAARHARSSEYEKCLSALQPCFAVLPDDINVPAGLSREYCAVTFAVGRARFCLMLLFPKDVILSPDGLRDIGLLAGYFTGLTSERAERSDRDFDLTEREVECLSWIAEGKTSDEIAMILGISRNTINNYITSIMRKTQTKTRVEAIAFAVRNNLV